MASKQWEDNTITTGDSVTAAEWVDMANAIETNSAKPSSDTTGVTGADAITNIISLTQAEYDAIGSPNASTVYIITDA